MTFRLGFVLLLLSAPTPLLAQQGSWSVESVWLLETGAPSFGGVEVVEGVLYSGDETGQVVALEISTGESIWKARVTGAIGSSVTADDKRAFLHTRNGVVVALDKQTGETLWSFQTEGERQWDYWDYTLSTPVADDRQLYFGSGDHNVYALDKRSGALRWKVRTGNIVHTRPAIGGEKVIVGGFDGRLYAIDRGNGKLMWTFKTVGNSYFRNGEIPASASIDGNLVYVGSRDYNIYAVLADTGTGAWNERTPSWIVGQPLVAGDSLITVNSDGAAVRSYEKESGKLNWEVRHSYNMFAGAVAVGDSHIAVAGLDGTIAFLSLKDGALSASWETPSRRASKDRFFDGEGNIDYSGIKSLEDLHGHYNDFLTHLGGISGQMFSDGEVVYFASGDGSIGAVKMVRQ